MVLYPDVAPFADNRFDCCDLLQRSVIHHATGKASGISSWYSCQTDRLQTICLKRRTSVFGVLGPIRTCESNLKPWAMRSWSRQLNSTQSFRKLPKATTPILPPHEHDNRGQAAFCPHRLLSFSGTALLNLVQ